MAMPILTENHDPGEEILRGLRHFLFETKKIVAEERPDLAEAANLYVEELIGALEMPGSPQGDYGPAVAICRAAAADLPENWR